MTTEPARASEAGLEGPGGTVILTLNIKAGGGKRVERICEFITSVSPDLALLTEYRRNAAGADLQEALRTAGFEWQVQGTGSPRENSVLLISRRPLVAKPLPALLAGYGQRAVLADRGPLAVLGVYLPPKRAKRPLFQALVEASPELLRGPAVLLGDLNTGRHYLDEPGATYVTADLFVALERLGWVDAYRHRHPQGREASWFSRKGNGFRLDHVFLSEPLVSSLTSAEYHHEIRRSGATDHAALVVRLGCGG